MMFHGVHNDLDTPGPASSGQLHHTLHKAPAPQARALSMRLSVHITYTSLPRCFVARSQPGYPPIRAGRPPRPDSRDSRDGSSRDGSDTTPTHQFYSSQQYPAYTGGVTANITLGGASPQLYDSPKAATVAVQRHGFQTSMGEFHMVSIASVHAAYCRCICSVGSL